MTPPRVEETSYAPGTVPQVVWDKNLWLIRPSSEGEAQRRIAQAIRDMANSANINLTELVSVRHRDPDGRGELSFLRPVDSYRLYRTMHRRRLGVLSTSACRVQKDITEKPSRKGSISLESFVDTKGAFGLISRPQITSTIVKEVIDWMDSLNCANHRDERCLPWHIFSDSVERIAVRKNKSGDFIDDRGRIWQGKGPYHSRDLLQVGGCTLPVGFHYDVQTSRDTTFCNGWEKWKVRGRGYANIHPDAKIRGGAAVKIADAFEDASGQEENKKEEKARSRRPRHQRSKK